MVSQAKDTVVPLDQATIDTLVYSPPSQHYSGAITALGTLMPAMAQASSAPIWDVEPDRSGTVDRPLLRAVSD